MFSDLVAVVSRLSSLVLGGGRSAPCATALLALTLAGLTAPAGADVVVDSRNEKRETTNRAAKINDIKDAALIFQNDNRIEEKVPLAVIKRVEISDNREKDLNDAETLFAEGADKYKTAAVKYTAALRSGTPKRWKTMLIRYRLMTLAVAASDAEKFAQNLVELARLSPNDAKLLLPAEYPAGTPGATKIIETAIGEAAKAKQDTSALVAVRDKWGGKADVPPTPSGTTGPATKTGPVVKGGGQPPTGGPATAAEGEFDDLIANLAVADTAHISRVADLYKRGSAREAADSFVRAELPPQATTADTERYLVAGGMACIKTAQAISEELDSLKAQLLQSKGNEADKLRAQIAETNQRRVRYLSTAAIALSEVLQLPNIEKNKDMAEPAYWCGWAFEKLNRPTAAVAAYRFYLGTFPGANDVQANAARVAIENLSQTGN